MEYKLKPEAIIIIHKAIIRWVVGIAGWFFIILPIIAEFTLYKSNSKADLVFSYAMFLLIFCGVVYTLRRKYLKQLREYIVIINNETLTLAFGSLEFIKISEIVQIKKTKEGDLLVLTQSNTVTILRATENFSEIEDNLSQQFEIKIHKELFTDRYFKVFAIAFLFLLGIFFILKDLLLLSIVAGLLLGIALLFILAKMKEYEVGKDNRKRYFISFVILFVMILWNIFKK